MEILSDDDIRDLIEIKKVSSRKIDARYLKMGGLGQRKANFEVQGVDGSRFKVKIRQSSVNLLDFSIILSFCSSTTNRVYNLRRYNGNSHKHINKIEGNVIDHKFHKHIATERYLRRGFRIEGFANETDEYHTIEECLIVFQRDCNIVEGNTSVTRLQEFDKDDG